jgi:PhzF family phenazine biosynthesis protein
MGRRASARFGAMRFLHSQWATLCAPRRESDLVDFPGTPAISTAVPPDLERALGVKLTQVGRTSFDYLVELDSDATVRTLNPDLMLLASLPVRGVIVTARSDSGKHDFVSRFFAPQSGVPEDPVTGSAHCGLAPYWAQRLGKQQLAGYQASPRGGTVLVKVHEDRVYLGGEAVTMLRGEILH